MLLSLSLFVLWVLANHVQPTVTLNDLAFGTAFANGCCNFHAKLLFKSIIPYERAKASIIPSLSPVVQ
jgi:hypothetical protein